MLRCLHLFMSQHEAISGLPGRADRFEAAAHHGTYCMLLKMFPYCLICFSPPHGSELLLRDDWQTKSRWRQKKSQLSAFYRACREWKSSCRHRHIFFPFRNTWKIFALYGSLNAVLVLESTECTQSGKIGFKFSPTSARRPDGAQSGVSTLTVQPPYKKPSYQKE